MLLSKRRMESERIEYLANGLTPEQAKKNRTKWIKIFDLCSSVVAAMVIIFVIFTFVCRPTSVVGESMNDTLQNGDWLITTRESEYKYGDIVIITQPNIHNEPLIKRVIATEGQTIEINFTSGQVFIDGEEINEPYIKELIHSNNVGVKSWTVEEGKLFCMGDNRNHSSDSRDPGVGQIDTRYILGKARFRILPFGNFDIYSNFTEGDK